MHLRSNCGAVRRILQSSLLLAVAACGAGPGQREYSGAHYPNYTTLPASPPAGSPAHVSHSREVYPVIRDNRAESTYYRPVSTFSIDVDTAAYANVRRYLKGGRLPPHDAVRTEELVNYFTYVYEAPGDPEAPFRLAAQIVPTPWNAETRLLHIGVKGYNVPRGERPRANLVLLIDVSGSMKGPDRLDLLKTAFRFLVDSLKPDDHVAIVTYSGWARVALAPTSGARKAEILSAIDRLSAGGSTAGAEGLRQAYRLAERHFDHRGINRVILASDGDFNVGESDPETLRRLIAQKRQGGVYLTVLTVGDNNLNEGIAQALAQSGNGQAAHLDSRLEAQKVLREQFTATLVPIAKDVKIQLEFNPALVRSYRLLGYETRKLAQRDFADDRVDAGEIGSGHGVTAIYEITPTWVHRPAIEPLRYQPAAADPEPDHFAEYAHLRIAYKLPDETRSRRLERPISRADERTHIVEAPGEVQFAIAVAAFAERLRNSPLIAGYPYSEILALARQGRGPDPFGYRGEFLQLVQQAEALSGGY